MIFNINVALSLKQTNHLKLEKRIEHSVPHISFKIPLGMDNHVPEVILLKLWCITNGDLMRHSGKKR